MNQIAYYINGKEVTRDQFMAGARRDWLQRPPMVANTYTEHDPLISDGVGCMKSQVPEMREVIRKHNIQGAQVLPNGQIRFTSRRARKELLRVRGLCDNEGSYGD